MASFVYNTSGASAEFGSQAQQLASIDHFEVSILEWPMNGEINDQVTASLTTPRSTVLSVSNLIARENAKLRIIFAPLDIPYAPNVHDLQALFSHFKVPAEFIDERLRSVTHSFGWHQDRDSSYVCWLHFLCKNVELVRDEYDVPSIRDPRDSPGTPMSQYDGTWQRSGYFIRWKEPPISDRRDGMVELVIFSASRSLRTNLESLVLSPDWEQALTDPFCLLIVVLDDLFRQVDYTISKVLTVFREMEHTVLQSVQRRASNLQFDFVGIHNIAKHIIYLKESSSATYSTANHIYEQHRELMAQPKRAHANEIMRNVQELLQHKLSLLEGCRLRVQSMESRVQNTINLAFNAVNQQDSQVVKSDSQSMKGIAIVTMLFLPTATVGSVCGSQFFNFDSNSRKIVISNDFGFFWAATVSLTVVVFAVYWLWLLLGERISIPWRKMRHSYKLSG